MYIVDRRFPDNRWRIHSKGITVLDGIHVGDPVPRTPESIGKENRLWKRDGDGEELLLLFLFFR